MLDNINLAGGSVPASQFKGMRATMVGKMWGQYQAAGHTHKQKTKNRWEVEAKPENLK